MAGFLQNKTQMKISLFFSLFFLSHILFSQALPKLIPYREGKKWGYCDTTGKIILQPQWNSAGLFKNGNAIISINNKYGLIDTIGKILIEPQYGYMERQKNYFVVQNEKQWFINEKNERVDDFDDPVYTEIAAILSRKCKREIKNVFRLHGDYYQASYDTNYVFDDKMGDHHFQKSVTEPVYFLCNGKAQRLTRPTPGSIKMLCPDLYYITNRTTSRVVTAKGLVVGKIKSLSAIENGLYRLRNEENTYIVDSAKCELFMCSPSFSEVGPYKNNCAHAKLNTPGKHEEVLVDRNGNPFTKAYNYIGDYSEGLCVFQDVNTRFGYLDEKGNEMLVAKYTRAFDFKEGVALVEMNGDFYYIDVEGKKILDVPFTYKKSIQDGNRIGRLNVADGDYFGFSNGLAIFEKGGKFGYINKSGSEVIPAIYDFAEPFLLGTALVYLPTDTLHGLYTYFAIDVNGNKKHQFSNEHDGQTLSQYAIGFIPAAVMKTKRWRAFYDRNNWVIFNTNGTRTTQPITALYNENTGDGRLIKIYLGGKTNDVGYITLEGKKFFKE
jgi:hypothetical protein